MNIQKINMLSLDNQIKMKEDGTAPVSAPVEQAGAEPKNIMKAMNMQGQANYMNNLAFQGGLKNKAAAYAMGTLLALGAMSLASCSKDIEEVPPSRPIEVNVETNVSVNMSSLVAVMQQMLEQQRQRDEIDAKRWLAINNFMNDLMALVKQGQMNEAEFYKQMFTYMVENNDNQKLILTQLEKNGMSQDEANKLIQQLINEVKDGKVSAQEAWAQIQKQLGSIDNSLKSILENLQGARQEIQRLVLFGYINAQQNAKVLDNLDKIIAGQDKIAGKIDKNTATIEEVAANLGMSLDELKSLLYDMGYALTTINRMGAEEIIKAINANTAVLNGVKAQITDTSKLVEQGIISNDLANKLIIELLKNINANVESIKNSIGSYYGNDPAILEKLDKIIEQGDTQIAQNGEQTIVLNNILSLLKNGVSKDDIKILIDYAEKDNADMDKLLKLVAALNQNVTDGRAENKKFAGDVIETLNKLGMENANNFTTVINKMGSMESGAADLRALVQKFMDAYNDGSKLTNAQLKAILDAIKDIKIDGGAVDLTSLENMMKDLVGLTRGNNNLLTSIDAKIGLINVTQNAILDAIDKMHKDIKDLPNYKQDLAEIKALLQGLKDKPGYDDTKVLNKLAEILEVIKTHEFCKCKCDPNSGHNEGIISDINDIIG